MASRWKRLPGSIVVVKNAEGKRGWLKIDHVVKNGMSHFEVNLEQKDREGRIHLPYCTVSAKFHLEERRYICREHMIDLLDDLLTGDSGL